MSIERIGEFYPVEAIVSEASGVCGPDALDAVVGTGVTITQGEVVWSGAVDTWDPGTREWHATLRRAAPSTPPSVTP